MLAELFTPKVPPAEVIFRVAFIYLLVLVLFRLFGRTQQARHAGFDLAVLFLLGSALRKTLVADDESLTTGAIALVTLFSLDWLVSLITFRNERLSLLFEGRPRLVVKDGAPLERELARRRINVHELREHLREKGTEDLSRVRAAYVERDGRITFVMQE